MGHFDHNPDDLNIQVRFLKVNGFYVLRELELTNNQMGLLIKKVLLQMNHMKISELPVLLYQLLKIGKKVLLLL